MSKLIRRLPLLLSFFLCINLYAQNKTITGSIKDQTGEPMIGVNVLVKGTLNGSITNIDGFYTLQNVDRNATLVVSYIGYETQEILVADRSEINVVLKDDQQTLEEVVVVGYGVQKKSDLTGSIASVSSERIASVGTTSPMAALQGASPGVDITTNSTRPGSSFEVQIRGQNSLAGGKPLYVVDGIITSDIDFLNPSDIERIDVLKDASSTAIYGSRGSNGVVIVQTKGASSAKSKLSISYDGFYGVRKIARTPDFMDGREWVDYRTSRYYGWNGNNQAYELTSSNQNAVTQNSSIVHNSLYNEDYTDWLKLGTQNGSQQNHFLSISGMAKDISYNIGFGYQTEEGNFLLEELDKYSLKGSVNHKPNKYFSTGLDVSMSHQIINTGSEYGYRDLMRIPNVLKAYRENGELIEQPGIKAEINGDGNFTSAANPLIEIASGSNESRRFDILGSFYLEVKPIDGLSLKTTFSPRFRRLREGFYREKNANRSKNQAQSNNTENFDWTWDNVITYNKTFKESHRLNVTLINSFLKNETESLKVFAEDFPYDSKWYNLFNGTIKPGNSSSGYSQISMISYAARVNYDYKGKYLATGTVRYDGSSKLADKWKAFPSLALAWRMSEENFMQSTEWINNIKWRLSFGYSGNNNIDAYSTIFSPNTSSSVYYDFNGSPVTGFATGSPVNRALTWEKTREWNFGVDFGFLSNRITGSIDLYDKLSDGLLMQRMLALESGVSSMTDNVGSVNNRGIEVMLNTTNISTKDWEWTTTFTFAYNKNSIKNLFGKKEDVIASSWFIGRPINVIYDYKVDGVYSKAEWEAMSQDTRDKMGAKQPGYPKVIDTNNDGKITVEDQVILGQVDPRWTGSINSTLRYKDWDFSFNIYTRQGSFVNDRFSEEFNGAANTQRGRPKVNFDYYVPDGVPRFDWNQAFTTDDKGNHWATWGTSTENANAKYPVAGMTGDFYGKNGSYQKTSFVKVRNITLGYTLPKRLSQKAFLSHARIYLNILNPFTFSSYGGWDPEYATTSLQNGNGPSSVTYQVGVNLKF